MYLRITFCLMSSLLLRNSAPAQLANYQFRRIDIDNGLSHNQVTSFLKDSKGFLWIGTYSGLAFNPGREHCVFTLKQRFRKQTSPSLETF